MSQSIANTSSPHTSLTFCVFLLLFESHREQNVFISYRKPFHDISNLFTTLDNFSIYQQGRDTQGLSFGCHGDNNFEGGSSTSALGRKIYSKFPTSADVMLMRVSLGV